MSESKRQESEHSPEQDVTEQNLPREMENIQAGLERVLEANLSVEQKTRIFNNLREIGNGLWGVRQGSEVSKYHLTNVMDALDAASALTAIEPLRIFQPKAQRAIDGLNKRYGVTPVKGK